VADGGTGDGEIVGVAPPPGPFSGRFILVIVGLVVAYMLAMWFAWCGESPERTPNLHSPPIM
jgi:hypothetical protein